MKKQRQKLTEEYAQLEDGYVAFHVPKTGGSTLREIFSRIGAAGYRPPHKLNHRVNLPKAARLFPDAKVCVVLRDPIERTVSGFYSRLRNGRPVYSVRWSPAEAAAFSFFSEPIDMLRALSSSDNRLQSAAIYALWAIRHIRDDYRNYFISVEMIEKHKSRFAVVGELNRLEDFVTAIAQRADPSITDVSPFYDHVHKADIDTRSELDGLSQQELAGITEFFAPEYVVYNHLKTLINC